jgi:hypothetical protein
MAEYITMRDYVARLWPFTLRYFDGAWLVKWGLRTTWANRKKAAVRAEKGMYHDICKYISESDIT